jgi:beta-phosphoglucomutase-like phosphatase (HAD superfamily)
MKTIILDLNGVVLEKADGAVIKKALAELGRIRSVVLFLAYKFGRMSPGQASLIMPIVAETENEIRFLPQAADAIRILAAARDTRLKICSNFSSKSAADEKLLARINEDCGYIFLEPGDAAMLPLNEGKGDFYRSEAAKGGDVIVVDDSMRNIRAAKKAGCRPVLISSDRGKIRRARSKYGAEAGASLYDFARRFAREQ